MEFKGGVVIIGSLLWESTVRRYSWRSLYLRDITSKTPVAVKIRYGRPSTSRKDTYSMIFSNHPSTKFGQGFIVGFKDSIKSFRALEKQAVAMASAENLWTDNPTLNKRWGTVGLLINPNIDSKNKSGADIIRDRWTRLYQNYRSTFNPDTYCIENERSVIDQNGFLLIDWTEAMNDYDFLIATPVVPKIKIPLSPKEVASKMIEKNYTEYFDRNTASGISTFQDEEIKQFLGRK
jgi:hypothetical protein